MPQSARSPAKPQMMSLIQEENKNSARQQGFTGNDLGIPPMVRFAMTTSSAGDPVCPGLLEPPAPQDSVHFTNNSGEREILGDETFG